MAFTRWAQRRTRKRVRRGLRRFDARLPSSCPGIGFNVKITATVITPPPYAAADQEIVRAIRQALRAAAREMSLVCAPEDLAAARDRIEEHLQRQRALPTEPPVAYQATLALDLLPEDQAGVANLLAVQRRQALSDVVSRQQTQACAAQLAEPAALLVRWLDRDGIEWSKVDAVVEAAERAAGVFAQYRPDEERDIEYQALEVLREFLSSFPDHAQKRMLYTLLAAGMDGAQRPHHAAKAQALLNGHAPTTSGSST